MTSSSLRRRRVAALASVLMIASALVLGCNAILGIDPPVIVSGEGGGPDSAAADSNANSVDDGPINGGDAGIDGNGDGDAANDGGDGAPGIVNLLKNPGLENDCLGWTLGSATKAEDALGHTGVSCRVCQLSNASVWNLTQRFDSKGLTPGIYRLEAWLRRAPTSAAFTVFASIHVDNGPSTTIVENSGENESPTLNDNWQLHSVSLDYTTKDGGSKVEVAFVVRGGDGCFLIDDAAFFLK